MDSESNVISKEYKTKDELLNDFTKEDIEEINGTICLLLCDNQSWLECLEELVPFD